MKDYKDLWPYQIHKIFFKDEMESIEVKHTLRTGNESFRSHSQTLTLNDFELCKSFDLVSDDVITHSRTGTFDKGILQLFVLSTAKF